MKTTLLLFALASTAFASPPVLVRPTAEAIARIQQSSPMSSLEAPLKKSSRVARPSESSIVNQSVVLHHGGNWTIVPKGAIIHLPETMKGRVNAKPTGTLLPWAEFLARNNSWLTVSEVSFEQAAGIESLPAKHAAEWSKQDKMVVAVQNHGPTSVRIESEL